MRPTHGAPSAFQYSKFEAFFSVYCAPEEGVALHFRCTMGRRQIEILRISDDRKRRVTFNKRCRGLLKKAHELEVLTGCHISLSVSYDGKFIHTVGSYRHTCPQAQREHSHPSEIKERLVTESPSTPNPPKPKRNPKHKTSRSRSFRSIRANTKGRKNTTTKKRSIYLRKISKNCKKPLPPPAMASYNTEGSSPDTTLSSEGEELLTDAERAYESSSSSASCGVTTPYRGNNTQPQHHDRRRSSRDQSRSRKRGRKKETINIHALSTVINIQKSSSGPKRRKKHTHPSDQDEPVPPPMGYLCKVAAAEQVSIEKDVPSSEQPSSTYAPANSLEEEILLPFAPPSELSSQAYPVYILSNPFMGKNALPALRPPTPVPEPTTENFPPSLPKNEGCEWYPAGAEAVHVSMVL